MLGKATADAPSSAAVVTPKAASAGGGASPRVNPYVSLAPAAVTPPTAKASEYAFEWSPAAEPHASRRTAMLAAYSKQIRALYGPDATVVVKVLVSLVVQVAIASVAAQLPWWAFVVVAYTIGGTLNHGLTLDGKVLKPARVGWQNEDQLRFILREGRKRQIRRMCEAVGLEVVALKRVRIGRVLLGELPVGKWRLLGPDESFA